MNLDIQETSLTSGGFFAPESSPCTSSSHKQGAFTIVLGISERKRGGHMEQVVSPAQEQPERGSGE